MEKIHLESNSKNMKDKKMMKGSQYGYKKEKSYFNNLSDGLIGESSSCYSSST